MGERNPYGVQYLLNRARWDADKMRDMVLEYVREKLGDENGVGALDETGFLKKGKKSVGVGRQYTGTAGRIENCQVGVFLSYATNQGRALIDRELYVPQDWFKDGKRCKEAGIPDYIKYCATNKIAGRQWIGFAGIKGL